VTKLAPAAEQQSLPSSLNHFYVIIVQVVAAEEALRAARWHLGAQGGGCEAGAGAGAGAGPRRYLPAVRTEPLCVQFGSWEHDACRCRAVGYWGGLWIRQSVGGQRSSATRLTRLEEKVPSGASGHPARVASPLRDNHDG
jgi:hypothetical protein